MKSTTGHRSSALFVLLDPLLLGVISRFPDSLSRGYLPEHATQKECRPSAHEPLASDPINYVGRAKTSLRNVVDCGHGADMSWPGPALYVCSTGSFGWIIKNVRQLCRLQSGYLCSAREIKQNVIGDSIQCI